MTVFSNNGYACYLNQSKLVNTIFHVPSYKILKLATRVHVLLCQFEIIIDIREAIAHNLQQGR